MSYSPDGKTQELFNVVAGGEFALFQVTTRNWFLGDPPATWTPKVQEAVRLKTQGEYLRASQILTSMMLDEDALYTQLTDILYEVEACAGLVKLADQYLCHMIQTLEMEALTHRVPIYQEKLRELVSSFDSEQSLRTHLAQLCGNPDYILPRPYAELKSDLTEMVESSEYAPYHQGLLIRSNVSTLIDQGDGSYLVAPVSESAYLPDGKFDELRNLVKTFLTEFDVILNKGLSTSSDTYPMEWDDHVRQCVELKRRGRFLESARGYVDISRQCGTVYTGILNGLFKTVASGGDLLQANLILMRGQLIYSKNPHNQSAEAAIPSNFADHLSRMVSSLKSPALLEDYLRSISGNPSYYLPRDYDAMVGELRAHYAEVSGLLEKSKQQQSSGCYIATAVYGSYDCPEVWVLRRFRDRTLAKYVTGRAFIRTYYATAPIALRVLGRHSGRLFRRPISTLVRALKARGYSEEPYADGYRVASR